MASSVYCSGLFHPCGCSAVPAAHGGELHFQGALQGSCKWPSTLESLKHLGSRVLCSLVLCSLVYVSTMVCSGTLRPAG